MPSLLGQRIRTTTFNALLAYNTRWLMRTINVSTRAAARPGSSAERPLRCCGTFEMIARGSLTPLSKNGNAVPFPQGGGFGFPHSTH